MFDSQLSDADALPAPPSLDTPESPNSQEVVDRLAHIARKAGKALKPPLHPKYAFRSAIQSSRELKGATKLVALLLADFINVNDGYAYPTLNEIMGKLGLPESTAKRALRHLQDRTVKDKETGEVKAFFPGWFRREATKSPNGADYRNHWHPIYARAGLSEGEPLGGQNEPLGGHERTPRGPSAAPYILTGYSPSVVIEGDAATLAPSVMSESQKPSHSAAGLQHEGPAFPSGNDRPKAKRQAVEKIALPDGCPFVPDDVAKRLAKDLTADDITAAESSYREMTAGDLRTPAEWERTAKAWLRRQEPVEIQASTTGTLLPNPFTFDDVMLKEAKAFGLTDAEVTEATKAFVDRYRSVSGPMALSRDWKLTWRGWMREAANRKKRSNKPTNGMGQKKAL